MQVFMYIYKTYLIQLISLSRQNSISPYTREVLGSDLEAVQVNIIVLHFVFYFFILLGWSSLEPGSEFFKNTFVFIFTKIFSFFKLFLQELDFILYVRIIKTLDSFFIKFLWNIFVPKLNIKIIIIMTIDLSIMNNFTWWLGRV